MKRMLISALCALTALAMLAGTAGAASVTVLNGPVSLTVTPADGGEEKKIMEEAFKKAAECAIEWVNHGIDTAMRLK